MPLTAPQLRRGYGPIYRYITRCGDALSTNAKLVLLNILERAGENTNAWPTQQTMCDDLAIAERTVRNATGELVAIGLVSTQRRGLGLSNVYTVHIETILAWAENGLRPKGDEPPETDPPDRQESAPLTGATCRSDRQESEPLSGTTCRSYLLKNRSQGSSPKEEPDPNGSGIAPEGASTLRPPRKREITEAVIDALQAEHPALDVRAVAADYLNWSGSAHHRDKVLGLRNQLKRAAVQARYPRKETPHVTPRPSTVLESPDDEDPILRRIRLDADRETQGR